MLLSFMTLLFVINEAIGFVIARNSIFVISRSSKPKYSWAWIALGALSMLFLVVDIIEQELDAERIYREVFYMLLGVFWFIQRFNHNRITAKGVIIETKFYHWDKIISWNWKFEGTNTLILLIPTKSKRKPNREILVEIPTEKVEQVNNLLYQYIPEKFSQSNA